MKSSCVPTGGTYVSSGGYNTSVCYKGVITDGSHVYNGFYTWAGNVNTTSDPAPGVPYC